MRGTVARALTRACAIAVVLLVAIAGGMKLAAIDQFVVHLKEWVVVRDSFASSVAVVVILSEMSGGIAFVVGGSLRLGVRITLGVLVAITAAVVIESIVNEPPDCNCYGPIQRHLTLEASLKGHLFRNTLFMIPLAAQVWGMRGSTCQAARSGDAGIGAGQSRDARTGFALMELLVSIAVIAVLISIAIPVMGLVWSDSKTTATLANCRAGAAVNSIYASDHDGSLLWPGSPEADGTVTLSGGRRQAYFESHATWFVDLGESYVPDHHSSSLESPFDKDSIWGDYLLTCTVFAEPRYWNRMTRSGPGQWRATNLFSVALPSSKGMMHDAVMLRVRITEPKPYAAAFFDGSAAVLPLPAPGYFKGDGGWPGRVHEVSTHDGLHTIDGIKGRDR